MYNKIEAKLIYVVEVKNEEDLELEKKIKADLGDVFNNKYYNALDRDVELTNTIRIREHYRENYLNGQLRYVEIDEKRYIIDKISSLKGRFILLDLAEDI